MAKKKSPKRYSPEKIVEVLRRVEIARGQGDTVAQAVGKEEISENTYYRWKRQYGAMERDDVKRLRQLEKENQRLKNLVAELSLDKDILKEALKGKH